MWQGIEKHQSKWWECPSILFNIQDTFNDFVLNWKFWKLNSKKKFKYYFSQEFLQLFAKQNSLYPSSHESK